jgi:hypothetical protein
MEMKDSAITRDDTTRMKEAPELGDAGDFTLRDYQEAERKVVAKLDLYITPVLFIVYLSCFIDRANIGMKVFHFPLYSRLTGDSVVSDTLIPW